MRHLSGILKYGFWGGITTLINLILFYVFSEVGLYYLIANALSYYIAVLINFLFNYYLVFDNVKSDKSLLWKFWNFCVLRTASFLVDSLLFFILVSILDLNKYISRVFLSIVIILFNFIWSKNKIFK